MVNNSEKIREQKFSVVIPCRNEERYIGKCLDSIFNQNYPISKIEIIVVDGISEDNTINIIKEYQKKFNNIILLTNQFKKTPQGLNIGIKNSSGEIIVILGAHATIDKNFIKFNNELIQEKNVYVTGGTQENLGLTFTQNLIGTAMELPFAMGSAKYRWSNKEQYVDTVVYAAYKKELFNEIGYFEENFTISEDAELNWRIRNAGYKILYSPKIKSYYYPRDSIISFIKQIFRYGILRVNVVKKHFNSIKLLHLIPPIFVIILIITFLTSLLYKVGFNVLLIELGIYFLINIITIFLKLFPNKLSYLLFMPFLIFIMHISWGTGFIYGLIKSKETVI
ncbi:MAG: glycosyltransferase family 2 protein [Ignavibacteriae bacterium]|nr:glycosyltransferase family 2 protein [Ignavibacteriota bacterium]